MIIEGNVWVPGDKSIGHRALMLAALGEGESRVEGLGAGGDLASTQRVLAELGVEIRSENEGLTVVGRGLRGLQSPEKTLDCGNSGTTMRLLCGVLAGQSGTFVLDGDTSLRRRPMGRVTRAVEALGGRFALAAGDCAPVQVLGGPLSGAAVTTEVASAQIKSAALLAGLQAEGPTAVTEPGASRDHTERMLRSVGVDLWRSGSTVHLVPPARLPTHRWRVPGDPSSAAFWLAAAALLPGSDVTLQGICLNPTRTGFLDVLVAMGVDVEAVVEGEGCGEPTGHIRVRSGRLLGTRVDGDLALRALDELPLVALLGALAEGETVVAGAAELRVKESDRIAGMAEGLRSLGARIEATADGWHIEGTGRLQGGSVSTHGDHRLAMCFQIAGLRASGPVKLDEPTAEAVSYPGFYQALQARCMRLDEES